MIKMTLSECVSVRVPDGFNEAAGTVGGAILFVMSESFGANLREGIKQMKPAEFQVWGLNC